MKWYIFKNIFRASSTLLFISGEERNSFVGFSMNPWWVEDDVITSDQAKFINLKYFDELRMQFWPVAWLDQLSIYEQLLTLYKVFYSTDELILHSSSVVTTCMTSQYTSKNVFGIIPHHWRKSSNHLIMVKILRHTFTASHDSQECLTIDI